MAECSALPPRLATRGMSRTYGTARAAAATRRRSTSGVGWGVARLRRCRAPRVPATPHHVGRFFRSAWAAIASRLKSFPLSPRERLARTTTVASAGTTNSDGATAHTTGRRLAAVATLVVCARLRIILIYSITSAASPSAPANTHARRRGFSPGYPCRDADARPNPTQAPAGLLHKFRAGCQTVVFSFHRSHRFPAIESHRPSPPLSRPARQSRVSWQLRRRPLVACLSASRRLRPFPGFFFSHTRGVQNLLVRAHDPRARISCFDQDLCSVSVDASTVGSMYWCRRQIKIL